jgi:hypothetical protein
VGQALRLESRTHKVGWVATQTFERVGSLAEEQAQMLWMNLTWKREWNEGAEGL